MKHFNLQHTALYRLLALVLPGIIFTLAACRKNDTIPDLSGTYSGRFLYASSGITYSSARGTGVITFNNGNYTSSTYVGTPTTNGVPTVGNGSYQLTKDSVNFSPANLSNTSQSGLNWLIGNYEYHFEGDSLIITKTYAQLSFNQYRLKRN